MGWVSSHIAGRFAYQFSDEYSSTPGSSSLNFNSSFSLGFTIKPKAGQTNYAMVFQGNLTANPDLNNVGNTLFGVVIDGYFYLKIFFDNNLYLHIASNNPVFLTSSVTVYELVWDQINKQFFLYVDGVSVPYTVLFTPGSSFNDLNVIGTSTILNNASNQISFGKALGYEQFEGIIYDAYLYQKARTSTEVTASWNSLKDTSTPATVSKILFSSNRLTSPARYQLYSMNFRGELQAIFQSSGFSDYGIRVLYSSNTAIHGTKICFTREGIGLVMANSDGSNPQVIVPHNGFNVFDGTIKPDGSKIIYSKYNNLTGYYGIYVADVNLTNNTISNETLLVGDSVYEYGNLDWSPDGNYIICVRRHVGLNTYSLLRIEFANTSNLLVLVSGTNQNAITLPRYNRQGTKIGYSQRIFNSSTYNYQVFTVNNVGGDLKQLTGDKFDNYFNAWSPDGNSITFFSNYNALYFKVWTMENTGRNKVNISGNINNAYSDAYSEWYQPV